MAEFSFGDKQVALVEEEKIDTLLTPVSVETLNPIALNSQEEQIIVDLKNQIDLSNSEGILNYGFNEQSQLSKFTRSVLNEMKSLDAGEVGQLVSSLAIQLETGGEVEESKGFIAKIFKKSVDKFKTLKIQYESAQSNIDRIVSSIENQALMLKSDNKELEEMKKANFEQFKTLKIYVEAGRLKVDELRANEVPRLEEKAKSGTQEDINELTQLTNQIHSFEIKLADLDAAVMASQISAAQLETITNANLALLQKLQTIQITTIPFWESNMTTMFYNEHTNTVATSTKKITEMTNQQMRAAAKRQHETSTLANEQAEEQTISVETIQYMNNELIESLKDIQRIRAKGAENRKIARAELENQREKLGQQLLETARTN